MTTSSAPRLEACVMGAKSAAARLQQGLAFRPAWRRNRGSARMQVDGAHSCSSLEKRMRVHRIALVERGVALELALRVGQVLVGAQHGAGEARALHLHQLVDQHVAGGADVARKPRRRRSRKAWLKARPSANLGKCRSMRSTPSSETVARIGVVGQLPARSASPSACVVLRRDEFQSHGHSRHLLFSEARAVGRGLERLDADAAQRGDEGLGLAVARSGAAGDRCPARPRSPRALRPRRTRGRPPCPAWARRTAAEPSEPPSVTWYHSLPSLSTPRMPMWPL